MSKRRPRDIGTEFTTHTIRYLQLRGWPDAELRNLAGEKDKGDIVGLPRLVIECKGGKQAETAGDALVEKWLEETERERRNAGADLGLLVMKRASYGERRAGEWWAVMSGWTFARLVHGSIGGCVEEMDAYTAAPVRVHLRTAVILLHAAGYGPTA